MTMNRRGLPAVGVALLIIVHAFSTSSAQQVVTIGSVNDGPYHRVDDIHALFQSEIRAILAGEYEVRFPDDKHIVGDWTLESARAGLERLLADPDVDIVLALGIMAGAEATRSGPFPKPVIAPFVIDSDVPGLPFEDGGSGVRNLAYLASPGCIERDLKAFTEIGDFTKLALLGSHSILTSFDSLVPHIARLATELGLEVSFVPVADSVDDALAAIPSDADAVYVLPILQLPPQEFDRLVQGINARRLPSFSFFGRDEIERGVLAGIGMQDFFLRSSRRVALMVRSILSGEDVGTLQVNLTDSNALLSINMGTARQVGLYPNFQVLTEAQLINTGTPPARQLSLEQAVDEAVLTNLDLLVAQRGAAAGEHAVGEARSLLLPRVDLSTLGLFIDEDRALLGTAERTWTASATLTQLLMSEPAWANYSIEKQLQETRVQEREQARLDITRDASVAFLNVLRAQTFEDTQKDNLNLTRSNLELARVRVAVGYSSRADLYRWETLIAQNRIDVIKAISARNQAEIQLNRLLHRPEEESFATQEMDLNDPALTSIHGRLDPYVDNPWDFKIFRNFMVQEALANAPELKALDAVIAVQERFLASSKRAFWLPEFALQADVTQELADGGTGARGSVSNRSLPFELPDRTDWSIGLSASIPLFTGAQRLATRNRAAEEATRARIERDAAAERVEQRIRFSLHAAGSSRAAIRLSREAADAAKNNLDLVTDQYSRGAVDILDLLDAQNSSLNTDLAGANAVHDFLVDWMEVERAAGAFFFFMTDAEVDAWFNELDAFFQNERASQ
jgi:outer membrane protein TolC